jgi:hypothetical protein
LTEFSSIVRKNVNSGNRKQGKTAKPGIRPERSSLNPPDKGRVQGRKFPEDIPPSTTKKKGRTKVRPKDLVPRNQSSFSIRSR